MLSRTRTVSDALRFVRAPNDHLIRDSSQGVRFNGLWLYPEEEVVWTKDTEDRVVGFYIREKD